MEGSVLSFDLKVVRMHVVVDIWLGAPVERSKGMSLFCGRKKGKNEEGIRCCWSLVKVDNFTKKLQVRSSFPNK